MPKYNKLVRDRIPEIIENSGKTAHTHLLSDEEYIAELDHKLGEEYAEYQADKNIEELADMLEVICAIAKARGVSVDELESIRRTKAEKNGAFEKKVFLEEVEDA